MENKIPASICESLFRYREDLIKRINANEAMTKWGLIESHESTFLNGSLLSLDVSIHMARKTGDWSSVARRVIPGPELPPEIRMHRGLEKFIADTPEDEFPF